MVHLTQYTQHDTVSSNILNLEHCFTTIRTNLRGFLQLSFYLSFFSVIQIKYLVLFYKQCYYKNNI